MERYEVRAGDTLWKIAERIYGDPTKFEILASANGMMLPDRLEIGRVLVVPDLDSYSTKSRIDIDSTTLKLASSDYYHARYTKRVIVLHFTAGTSARDAYDTFKGTDTRMATSYVVGRNGVIYQLFPPERWALHIFRHKKNENPIYYDLEKRSVGVEIVNVGPLRPDSNNQEQLNWWWPPSSIGQPTFGTKWCLKSETSEFLEYRDRDIDYFATFQSQQYQSISSLLDHLCTRFEIPKRAPADKLETDVNGLAHYRGVVSHRNFRRDKWDVGPAFDWSEIGLA